MNEISNMRHAQKQIMLNQQDVEEAQKKKTITIKQVKWKSTPMKAGSKCTNCSVCQRSCHVGCIVGPDKRNCQAMDSNMLCTICTGKCPPHLHKDEDFFHESFEIEVEEPVEKWVQLFSKASGGVATAENALIGLERMLHASVANLFELLEKAKDCIDELSEIALQPRTASMHSYVEELILSETDQKKPGWAERVEELNILKMQYELAEQLSSVEVQQFVDTLLAKNADDVAVPVHKICPPKGKKPDRRKRGSGIFETKQDVFESTYLHFLAVWRDLDPKKPSEMYNMFYDQVALKLPECPQLLGVIPPKFTKSKKWWTLNIMDADWPPLEKSFEFLTAAFNAGKAYLAKNP